MAGTLIIKVISTLLQTMAILLLDEENIFYLLGLITIVNLIFDRQNPIFISRTQSIFNLIKSIQLTYLLINSHDDEQLQIGMRIFMITSILRNLKILYAPKTPDKIKHRLLRVYYKAPFTYKYFQFIQDVINNYFFSCFMDAHKFMLCRQKIFIRIKQLC
ncbi:hypothetical protein pb186bvf_019344 [Paramecium bursaria]